MSPRDLERNPAAGFVLFEALVALVLLVFTVGLVAALLGFGQHVAARARGRDALAHVATGRAALAAWLAGASAWRPVGQAGPQPVLFEGRPDRLSFVSAGAGDGQPPGLLAVTVGFGGRKPGATGAVLFDAVPLALGEGTQPDRLAKTPLFDAVVSASFSYFGAPDPGTAARWSQDWTDAAALPRLVVLDAKVLVGPRVEDFHLAFRVRPE